MLIKPENIQSFGDVEHLRLIMNRSRDNYLPEWRTAAKFISPNRIQENSERNRGAKSNDRILRNIATRSLRTFISGMMNGATSRARPWFKLTLTNPSLKNTRVKRVFAQTEAILNEHLQISNFYRVLPMSYKDIGIFSNSAFAMLPHPRYGFYFMPLTVGTYAISTDSEGMVNMFTREFTLTIRQVVEQYGSVDAGGRIMWDNFDPFIKTCYEQGRYLEEVILANVILPNKDPVPASLFSAEFMPYQSYTYVKGYGSSIAPQYGGGTRYSGVPAVGQSFLSVKGYDYFPVIANRWELAPESDWGVDGPGAIALPDIQSLQETEKYRLEAIAKLVKPPMVGPASLRRHQSSILAGGITYVDEATEGTKYRAAFEIDPKLSELVSSQEQYEQAIRSAFYEDLFLMMAGDQKISHVTAREIEERASEKLGAIGPALGQLDQDQNSRVIFNGLHLLNKMGRLPEFPEELEGEEIRPEYISILAQAQKASMLSSTDKFMVFLDGMVKVTGNQALAQIAKADVIVRNYADNLGMSPDDIHDEEEFAEIQDGIAQQQAEQAQVEQMRTASETARNLSQAETPEGNMLAKMQQMSEAM